MGDLTVSGMWLDTETNLHINVLEPKAVFLAVKAFQTNLQNKRFLVALYNTIVAYYLNKEGGGDLLLREVSNGLSSNGFLQSQSKFAEGSTHSGLSKCDSRQPVMQGQNLTNRIVS